MNHFNNNYILYGKKPLCQIDQIQICFIKLKNLFVFDWQGSNCQLPSGDISYWHGNRWDIQGESWMGYR